MSYAHTTWTEAENQLASLLADTAKVRFLSAEIQVYLTEALRTWNALTGMFEATGDPVTVAAGTTFIDIPTIYPAFRGYTVTDRDVISAICYHFLEPATPAAWSGTEMFTLTQIAEALERRRDQFLVETGLRVTRSSPLPASPAVIGPLTETYELPSTTGEIRRVAWRTLGGVVTPLFRTSPTALRGFNPAWNSLPGTPRAWALDLRAPHTIGFAPIPADSGTIDLISVQAGADLAPGTSATVLGVPDDFAWVVKWGAMGTLLSQDGPSRDYARSLYCERRYRIGVAAALTASILTDARVEERPAQFTTLEKLDQARRTWQSRTGDLRALATIGHNLLALDQPPKIAASLQLSFVRNAPIPASGGAYLQIGKEHLDLIIGYALHLAMFKIAGTEFASTTHLAESFFTAALDYNEALAQSSAFEDAGIGRAKEEAATRGVRRVTGGTVE